MTSTPPWPSTAPALPAASLATLLDQQIIDYRWIAVGLVIGTAACATLQQYAALARVGFALDGVANGRLAGVDLEDLPRNAVA